MWSANENPITRREKTSITVARYSHPCHVRMYVMSPTHSMSGAGASNCPCTRSGIVGGVGSGVVVRTQRAGRRPRRPAAFINRATRLRPTSCPWARNSASTRGTPYCPPEAAWIARIFAVSAAGVCSAPAGVPAPPPRGGGGGPRGCPPTPPPRHPDPPPPRHPGPGSSVPPRKKPPPPLKNPPPPRAPPFPPPQPPQLFAL